MSLRIRLLAMFVSIIVLVAVTMGIYNFRLIEVFFRQSAASQLREVGPDVQRFIEQNGFLLGNTPSVLQVAIYLSGTTESRVLITDSRGTIFLDTTAESKNLVGQTVPSNLIGRTLQRGSIESFDYSSAGSDALAVAVPWVTGGRITGSIILIRSVQTVARQTALAVSGYVVRAALLASAVALVVAYLMSSSIAGPLRKMAEAARSISKGNFSEKVDVSTDDELGDLGEAMNSMSSEISTLIGNLTQEKEKLQALMEERTNMLSDISHDLRTPITSIRGFVEALKDGVVKDEDEKARTLDIIQEESERLSRLVDDLFYLARLEGGEAPVEMAEVDLVALVRGAVEAMSPISRDKGLTVTLDVDEDSTAKGVFRALGSADRLTRAILNILDNAIKFSPQGGSVKVALRLTEAADAGNHEPQTDSKGENAVGVAGVTETKIPSPQLQAIISISDQGPGISEEDLARIFERFYRADKARTRTKSGAGLGLSIARFIVEQHKGRMWVDTALGQGSTFHIALPLLS